jgi:murein L,D-transpeptidase YafK
VGTANQPGAPGMAKSAPASPPTGPYWTPGEIALAKATNPSIVDPFNWAVMVYKSRHELVVYFEGHLYKKYRAVFGRSLEPGTKEWAGDRRTPEGVYRVVRKRGDRRWHYFLQINYPNRYDRRVYGTMLADGEVPRIDGHVTPEGSAIGIHGTDEPMLNAGDINWTTGCVSVSNGAIDELDALLPIGTLVIIKP